MIEQLKFTLVFLKFSDDPITATFNPGLNIIYGESGVGKSDLVRQLINLPVYSENNYTLISKGVPVPYQVIFQNPDNQIICSTITRELAFSIECNDDDQHNIIECYEQAKALLPATINLDRHPATLSGGEKEILNIVTTISVHPQTLLIDDGLSFLSNRYKTQIINELHNLIKEYGTTVLWFTSEIEDCRFSDQIWELSLSELKQVNSLRTMAYPSRPIQPGKMSLVISDLDFNYDKDRSLFRNFNYKVESCRSFGIEGSNGSGKTTLAKLILGISAVSKGKILLRFADEKDDPSLGFLDQFPERMLGSGTLDIFAAELIKHGILTESRFRQCQRRMTDYQIFWDFLGSKSFHTISWSTLRFTLVFLLTHCQYDILILDEPTFGLGREQRLRMIKYLFDYLYHNHLILISHDHELINCLCDHSINLNSLSVPEVKEVIIDQAV